LLYHLIWYYHTLYPDAFIVLIIALLCFVHHDGITNCGGNSETCQEDNIVVLITNVVFISCTKTTLIYAIAQMTILHLVALGYIPWHSAVLQGTRLHFKAFGYIPRHSAPFQGTQLHSQGLNFNLDRLGMESPYELANWQGRLRARIT
jgi:hypothetical protein